LKAKSNLHYLSADKKREKVYRIIDSLQCLKKLVSDETFDILLYWKFHHIADTLIEEILTLANLYD